MEVKYIDKLINNWQYKQHKTIIITRKGNDETLFQMNYTKQQRLQGKANDEKTQQICLKILVVKLNPTTRTQYMITIHVHVSYQPVDYKYPHQYNQTLTRVPIHKKKPKGKLIFKYYALIFEYLPLLPWDSSHRQDLLFQCNIYHEDHYRKQSFYKRTFKDKRTVWTPWFKKDHVSGEERVVVNFQHVPCLHLYINS